MNQKEISFETYKKTRSIERAERERRIYNWQVSALVEFLEKDKIDDVYDLLAAGLLIKENKTTDYERKKYSKMLTEIGQMGFEEEENELRWRLQKHLKLKGDHNND